MTSKDASKTSEEKTPPEKGSVDKVEGIKRTASDDIATVVTAHANRAESAADVAQQSAENALSAANRAKDAAEAAGLTMEQIQAAFDKSDPSPSNPIEELQLRVARLEVTLFGLLNEHFGGKLPALANPPPLDGDFEAID
jgi:hypothetical protein